MPPLVVVACVALAAILPSVSTSVLYETLGQIHLGVVFTQCATNLSAVQKTALHSVAWTVQRVNELKWTNLNDFRVGLTVHQVCAEEEYFAAIFQLYASTARSVVPDGDAAMLLGILADHRDGAPRAVREFAHVLRVVFRESVHYRQEQIEAAVKMLGVLNWSSDLEVVAPDRGVLKEFYRITRREWMCVNRFHLHETFVNGPEDASLLRPMVFLGTADEIAGTIAKLHGSANTSANITEIIFQPQKRLLVPLDFQEVAPLQDNYHILQTNLAQPEEPLHPPKVIPSMVLFEMASPILQMLQSLTPSLSQDCQNSTSIKCLLRPRPNLDFPKSTDPITTVSPPVPSGYLSQKEILHLLKLESLSSEFHYLLTNSGRTLIKYSALEDQGNVTVTDRSAGAEYQLKRNISTSECFKHFDACLLECENFKSFEVTAILTGHAFLGAMRLRPEPWVYAFFSVSLLGIVFCVAIMGFIASRLCRKQMLEGNPILTFLLLIDVVVMFASVLPFALEGSKLQRYELHIIRALSVTIPYTFGFALLLARTILLATVSNEVGFMSHVAGTVQAFLTLFIFAVQCALSLQLGNTCEAYGGSRVPRSLLPLMFYNVVLLTLLVLVTPLIAKSKRNYREGRHFAIAIVLCACAWSCWLPAYAVLEDAWRDPLLCLGLVSTGSILLGGVFIPRTYMMTVSAARERFTSALPSLATATSAMDIYRASTQPVYDCVNVAAIAAANLRAQHEEERRRAADFYAAPDMRGEVAEEEQEEEEEEDEFEVQACDSPPVDKVTRF